MTGFSSIDVMAEVSSAKSICLIVLTGYYFYIPNIKTLITNQKKVRMRQLDLAHSIGRT